MKKLLCFILIFCFFMSLMPTLAAYSDIDGETLSWAGEAIEYLDKNSVINGYEDGSFRPGNSVTRAEFAKMLSLSFELKTGETSYDDIDGHWAYNYILSAADMVFADGTYFKPDEKASREFIAYALVKALNLKAENTDALSKFTDSSDISALAFDELTAAVENSIIKGYEDNTLRPQSDVTRAEAAALIYRAIKLKDTPEKPDTPILPDNPEISDDAEHIYGLYPGKNLLLVSAVTLIADNEKGEEKYKLQYYLADGEEEYSSVIPEDVKVEGIRKSVAEIKKGDVLIMDTAFHGKIGKLYVLAAFDGSIPGFCEYEAYSRGENYTLAYGKVTALKNGNKYTTLTLDNNGTQKNINVLSDISAYVFSSWRSNGIWSYEDLGAIDYEKEDVYVFARYTNGLSTDVIISDISR